MLRYSLTGGLILFLILAGGIALFAQTTGDVNNSGKADIVDALMTAQYYVGLNPQNFDVSVADVDGSGSINIIDALMIAQFYVGLLTSFPGGSRTPEPSPPPTGSGRYNYGEALQKTIFFYKAQRSGNLPEDYPMIWRGDSGMTDGEDARLDLTGGWYDAGDHVKFGLPMAYTAAQLAWAVYEYPSAFTQAGQMEIILDEIKWATDYFIKCHPQPNVFYYQVGTGKSDHGFWGPPEVIHLTTIRDSHQVNASTPGSDVAGQTAAALALASLIFADTNPAYAATCLSHARTLYEFADSYRGFYPLNGFYPSGSYVDDLAWAATWLHIKTGETAYLTQALSVMNIGMLGGRHTQCWDDVSYGATLKLAQITGDPEYIAAVESSLDWWLPGGGLTYTPGGLAWLNQWGSARYASTAAFLAFVWADSPLGNQQKKQDYLTFAQAQIHYILGDNPFNMSYIVGFGEKYPLHPHHKAAHGSWLSQLEVPLFHRHTLYGALVGGPGSDDIHNDDVKDYTTNEVADDYNAGIVGALAKMYSLYGGSPISGFPRSRDFRPQTERLEEFFTRGWIQYEGPGTLIILAQINNRSAWPPRVTDNLSCRYFIDLSEIFSAGGSINDITVTPQESEGATISGLIQWTGTIYYVDIDFSGTLLFPGGYNDCEKDARFRLDYDATSWNSANDWSYAGLSPDPEYDATTFSGLTDLIPVYENGALLWGREPPR